MVPLTNRLAVGDWATVAVPLRCFANQGIAMNKVTKPFELASSGALGIDVSSIRIGSATTPIACGAK
ncbi:MAG: hypothetical protein EOP65_15725 [Sphingomonas sp.]|nr:MAG: hypothetical protein EOP65_15725 [Sphingomonas sp.]